MENVTKLPCGFDDLTNRKIADRSLERIGQGIVEIVGHYQ
jgi:hypothetical protein